MEITIFKQISTASSAYSCYDSKLKSVWNFERLINNSNITNYLLYIGVLFESKHIIIFITVWPKAVSQLEHKIWFRMLQL